MRFWGTRISSRHHNMEFCPKDESFSKNTGGICSHEMVVYPICYQTGGNYSEMYVPLRESLGCHRGFDQSQTFCKYGKFCLGPHVLRLSPLSFCSIQPLKVARWGMRSKPPQSLLFIFCFASGYTLLFLGLWSVLPCQVNDLSIAPRSGCGGHFSLLRGSEFRVSCPVHGQDCMVFNHVFCVDIGGIYRVIRGTRYSDFRMPICRRDLDRVTTTKVLDATHTERPERYVDS